METYRTLRCRASWTALLAALSMRMRSRSWMHWERRFRIARMMWNRPTSFISGGRQRELLRTVALPFFDAYLKDDPAAVAFLEGVLPTLEGIRFEQSLTTGASSE